MSGLLFIIRSMVKSADRKGELTEVISVLCRAYCLIKEYTEEGVTDAECEYTCVRSFCNVRVVPAWFSALTAVVCKAVGCRWYFGRLPGLRFRRSVTFCGAGERPEVAGSLFALLCRQMERDMDTWQKVCGMERLKTMQTRIREDKWRISWTAGLWSALSEYDNLPRTQKISDIRQYRHQLQCQCCRRVPRRSGGATEEHVCQSSELIPVSDRSYIHIKEEQ